MFCKGFPLFSIRRIAFAKLRSFAHHANILVDLGPPKFGYLIAAGLRPTNHLSRSWTTTAKRSYFRMGLVKKNRPLWPLTVPLSPGSLHQRVPMAGNVIPAAVSGICGLPRWNGPIARTNGRSGFKGIRFHRRSEASIQPMIRPWS